MKKILLTAFEPFGDIENNSSEEVVKRIKDIENSIIVKKILKVEYNKEYFEKLLDDEYDYVLLCGQAAGRSKITLEQIAINFMYAKKEDNKGVQKLGEAIYEDGPDGIFNTINSKEIVSKLESNYPISLSLSAGAYICNLSFYVLLYQVIKKNIKTKIGFIHFPVYTLQTTHDYPSIDLEVMVNALDKIIEEIV